MVKKSKQDDSDLVKKSKPTIVKPASANKLVEEKRPFDDYLCQYSYRRKPISDAWLDAFALRMRQYPDNPNNKDEDGIEPLTFQEFLDKEGVSWVDLLRWQKRHEPTRLAHEYYIRRIGRRREKGAIVKRYEPSSIARNQWKYDTSDRDEQLRIEDREVALIKLKAELKSEAEGNSNQPIIIQMSTLPEVK